jgi:hypothetical protein
VGPLRKREADEISTVLARLDGVGEFIEDRYKPVRGVAIYAQFVVAATGPLH